jgi:hypothetical protein
MLEEILPQKYNLRVLTQAMLLFTEYGKVLKVWSAFSDFNTRCSRNDKMRSENQWRVTECINTTLSEFSKKFLGSLKVYVSGLFTQQLFLNIFHVVLYVYNNHALKDIIPSSFQSDSCIENQLKPGHCY